MTKNALQLNWEKIPLSPFFFSIKDFKGSPEDPASDRSLLKESSLGTGFIKGSIIEINRKNEKNELKIKARN